MNKKIISAYIEEDIYTIARDRGINISKFLNNKLKQELICIDDQTSDQIIKELREKEFKTFANTTTNDVFQNEEALKYWSVKLQTPISQLREVWTKYREKKVIK